MILVCKKPANGGELKKQSRRHNRCNIGRRCDVEIMPSLWWPNLDVTRKGRKTRCDSS